jgi:hypothetical protein
MTRSVSRFGPWLWGPRIDLAAFGGTTVFALVLVAVAHGAGLDGSVPEWAWVAFVLGIDVAHVWATLFRTYLDGDELRRHQTRYLVLPIAIYACGFGLYLHRDLFFWGALAYLAVFHFVRQQVGWVALYRARAGDRSLAGRLVDEAAVYAATLYPLVHWHAALPSKHFAWFIAGDFADVSRVAAGAEPWVRMAWFAALGIFAIRHLANFAARKTCQLGKIAVVASTATLWYVGIVATNSDFDFTVTNVIAHGLPYFVLLWSYGRARRVEAPSTLGSRIVAWGPAAFMGVLVALAFVEEFGWDHLVWHERSWLFGSGGPALGHVALALVVPLLAMPQAAHYLIDGFVWRKKETGSAQRVALGFAAGA